MTMKQHHSPRSLSSLLQALIVALMFAPLYVSCNPAGAAIATKSRSFVPPKAKFWGIKQADSSIPKQIIVMGGPAAGKGTQCQQLAEKHGLVHISSGDLLRQAVSSSTKGGTVSPHIKLIKECMEAGKLIPDNLMTKVILDRLRRTDCQKSGYILDGFPRTLSQAKSLEEAGIYPDAFIILSISDEEAINRVVGRRTDSVTGKVYHLQNNPPPNDEEVLKRLIIRSDDTEESMRQRLKQFRANVSSVEDWYRDIKREIDGSKSPSEVSRNIDSTLKQMRKRKQRV